MIQIDCRCGTPYSLGDHLAGRTFRCTKCQAILTVPAAGGFVPPPAAGPPPAYSPPPPRYAAPGAPPFAAPPPPPAGDSPRWGSSGTIGALPTDNAPPPPRPTGRREMQLLPDDESDAPPPRAEGSTIPEKLEISDEAPKRKQSDLLESSFEFASTEEDGGGLESSLEKSAEKADASAERKRPKKGSGRRERASDSAEKRMNSSAEKRMSGSAEKRMSGSAEKRGTGSSAERNRTGSSAERAIRKKGDSAERALSASAESRFAMECPVCEETIARNAKVCPKCGVPLQGGGLTKAQKRLLANAGKGAGVVVLLAFLVFAWKTMHEDTTGRGGPHGRATPSPEATRIDARPSPSPVETPLDRPSPAAKPSPSPTPSPSPEVEPSPPGPPIGEPSPGPRPSPEESRPRTAVPEGPLKADLEALRDARDYAAAERAALDLAAKPGAADAARACEKGADIAFRARLLRSQIASSDAATKKAAVERAFGSSDLECVLVGLEWSLENESADDARTRLVNLRSREHQVLLEGVMNAVLGASEPPSAVAVDKARAEVFSGGPDLAARLAPLLLAGNDGTALAEAPAALVSSSLKMRKAVQKGLESFAHRKSSKDPAADPEGARAEWAAWADAYAPTRSLLAKACADVLSPKAPAEAVAAAVDAKVEVIAHKRDVIPFLPVFAREALAHTSGGGAALGELIARICGPADRDALNAIVDSLTDDARMGAPAIVAGCLRAADREVASAAARAIDRGAVSFSDAAASFPDLLDPAAPPRTATDSTDPGVWLVLGAFRDGKSFEAHGLDLPRKISIDEPFARAGSRELEKRLFNIIIGKEKVTSRIDVGEAQRLVGEAGTRSAAKDVIDALRTAFEPKLVGMHMYLERCATSDQAKDIFAIVDKYKTTPGMDVAPWVHTAARIAAHGNAETRETLARMLLPHAKQVAPSPSPSPPPKPGKGSPSPAAVPSPAPTSIDPLRFYALDALVEIGGDYAHEDAVKKIEAAHADLSKNLTGPVQADLDRFLRTLSPANQSKDAELVVKIAQDVTILHAGEQDRLSIWVYRALARVKPPGEKPLLVIRDRVESQAFGMENVRGEAAAALAALHDTASTDKILKALGDPPDEKRTLQKTGWEPGYLAAVAVMRPQGYGIAWAKAALTLPRPPADVVEAALFALARAGTADEVRLLGQQARSQDPNVRASVARAIGLAVRGGGAGQAVALLDRLRVDPQPYVRAEAAIAAMDLGKDPSAMFDGALALELDKETLAKRAHVPSIGLAVGAEPETTLFLELARAIEHASKGQVKLEAYTGMALGRTREMIRTARAAAMKSK